MDIMELGAIGEMIGGVAVVATLGYLAIQIRQNTKSTRFLATQSLVAGQAESNFLMASHDDLAAIIQDVVMNGDLDRLEPHAQMRFSSFMIGIYGQVDFAYHQYLGGQLDESVWKRWDYELPVFLSQPGLAEWWTRDKPRFSAEFAAYVDQQLAEFVPASTMPTMGRSSNPR